MKTITHNGKVYEEIDCCWGYTIDQTVKILKEYNNVGELKYVDFNEHILYSDTVTIDSAYVEITGKTKAEFEAEQERLRIQYEEEERRRKAKA